MAMTALHPSTAPSRIEDPVTFTEAMALFAETGYAVPESNLRRWIKQAGLASQRIHGQLCYSHSDLLELHRDRVFGD